ncbi:hypothetical protein VOLCADRAFT_88832 [Volvox carteri f. nagariensis]|uniref:Uncharacterized protein n=1 Tax=Volvox carteri f. nagariensis TaxID=3068 RepID=D8TQ28_VOLCA|nr:uncharacterized protein VOLCADRAFT_88832 [Volvox carteri f. nagariensis]EFJ50331.1 hypothetical protein VOLCADRAFT_88832 [Volvox carteri f. nagariensis]|eukprot:XP_002948456.1 hypothetical protein VOLCADRAFT_88832 [Volvox carteri f. nagariensis]
MPSGLRRRTPRDGGALGGANVGEGPPGGNLVKRGSSGMLDSKKTEVQEEDRGSTSYKASTKEDVKSSSTLSSLNHEDRFRNWFKQQVAVFDFVSWVGELLLLALPTLAHNLGHVSGCNPSSSAAGVGQDRRATCPAGCEPTFVADAEALASFPCDGSTFAKLLHTIRQDRSFNHFQVLLMCGTGWRPYLHPWSPSGRPSAFPAVFRGTLIQSP